MHMYMCKQSILFIFEEKVPLEPEQRSNMFFKSLSCYFFFSLALQCSAFLSCLQAAFSNAFN